MIKLTRLNRTTIGVNCDLIQFAEETPDTVVTMVTGEKIVVKELIDEIIARIISFRIATGSACHVPTAGVLRTVNSLEVAEDEDTGPGTEG